MRTIVVLILMIWCGSAWAEDCGDSGIFGQITHTYRDDVRCLDKKIEQLQASLEQIAEAIKEKK